jgi:type II secretory pathway pseudopilin PulG
MRSGRAIPPLPVAMPSIDQVQHEAERQFVRSTYHWQHRNSLRYCQPVGASAVSEGSVVMSDPVLTVEAKAAIQADMLKFVIPSTAVIAIISGLFGYVLSGIARIDASAEAAKAALFAAQSAAKAETSAARASEQANKASDEASTSLERAKRAALSSEDTVKTLLTARDQVNKILAGQYDGLAKSLFEIEAFRIAIATVPQGELAEFRSQISKLEKAIYGDVGSAVAAPGGNCPPGTYAVSIGSTSVSGGRAGFLESISVSCRTLRFERPK